MITLLPWHWLLAGLALCGLEILAPSFFIIWFGLSACIVSGLVLLFPDLTLSTQLLVFSGISVSLTLLWFKWINPILKGRTRTKQSIDAAKGQIGMILDFNRKTQRGTIRFTIPVLGDSEWQCTSTSSLSPGDQAELIDIDGNVFIVAAKTN